MSDDLERIRNGSRDEVRRIVERQLGEIAVNGKVYKFKIEKRCRVCQDPAVRTTVNRLLVTGLSYANILVALEPVNANRDANSKINYNSIRTHAIRHLPIEDPAAAIYRRIVEEEADRNHQDWVDGVGSQVNFMSYLKTVEAKAFANLVNPATEVSIKEGMDASKMLHELKKEELDTQKIADAYYKLDTLIKAVKKVVPQDQWDQILKAVDAAERGEEYIDVQIEDEEEGDEDFDDIPEIDSGADDFDEYEERP